MEAFQSHAGLLDIVTPVLHEMKSGVLKDALVAAFSAEEEALRDIESAFHRLTDRGYPAPALRTFFASWSKTNNSAASVSGLANRITLLARSEAGSAASNQLHDVCASPSRGF
nr:hypothetical protein [Burkholderia ambifaria]